MLSAIPYISKLIRGISAAYWPTDKQTNNQMIHCLLHVSLWLVLIYKGCESSSENYLMAMYFAEFLLRTFSKHSKIFQNGGQGEANLMKANLRKVWIFENFDLVFWIGHRNLKEESFKSIKTKNTCWKWRENNPNQENKTPHCY